MKILITGGTGLIGRRLAGEVDDAVILSRDPARFRAQFAGSEVRLWEPRASTPSADLLGDADAVVNLAGEPIADGRWTPERKSRIRESRVAATRNLVNGLAKLDRRPSVLVNASAVGYYGDRGDEVLDEFAEPGTGFLPGLCSAWEAEALEAETHGIRVVCLRFGIVLSSEGGALARMLPPFRLGLGGRFGNGGQWLPWIHVDDAVGIILHAIARGELQGSLNAVAPQLVTNAEFTQILGDAVERPTLMAIPKLALQLGLGEMSELLLSSQRVVPRRTLGSGYTFRRPVLASALAAEVGESAHKRAA